MRLISLTSSRPTFKTVQFNSVGVSLIIGKHTDTQVANIQSTYNGVGKSLLIAIINFCLGSNRNRQFDAHLDGWDFTLAFEHGGTSHYVTRIVGDDLIALNGTEMRLKAYTAALDDMGIFDIPADAKGIHFRSLIAFFLRPNRTSYSSPEAPIVEWTAFSRVLYQSFLLGLDYNRVVQKHDAKKELDEQLALAKKYQKDDELRAFYIGDKNPEMELASLNERIAKLEDDLAQFQVAKDYSERAASADSLRGRLLDARNEEAAICARLEDIEVAMSLRPDVTPERVTRLYSEANVVLPDLIRRRLEEVRAFHERLRENRERRLETERQRFQSDLEEIQSRRSAYEHALDEVMQYLNAHGALDEYTENNRFLFDLSTRRRKIQDYLTLLERYENEAQRIRVEMTSATVQTTSDLKQGKPHLEMLMNRFRAFAKEFYGDSPAGLVVRNNDGENQIRYDIETRIEHDAADGINDVRIFCFDLLLLTLGIRHRVKFLFHDSRLFADMDWHQRLTLFRLADRVCREAGLQYIATINEDLVEAVRGEAGAQFEQLFVESRVLELTDEPNGRGKLLGIQVEMNYSAT